MVHALKSEMQKRGAGHLCVASAPFGGPTLLALMSLSITCKNPHATRTSSSRVSDVAVAAARAKFASECGVSLDDIGGGHSCWLPNKAAPLKGRAAARPFMLVAK